MQEELELPSVLFLRYDGFPSIWTAVLDLLESLVIECIILRLRALRHQADEEICAAQKDQDVTMIELELSGVVVILTSLLKRQLTVLDDVVATIALANDSNLLCRVSLRH